MMMEEPQIAERRGGPLTRPTYETQPMAYEEAMRVLLRGLMGCNTAAVARGTGLTRQCIAHFVEGNPARRDTIERIERFVWRRLNAHVFLDDGAANRAKGRDDGETEG